MTQSEPIQQDDLVGTPNGRGTVVDINRNASGDPVTIRVLMETGEMRWFHRASVVKMERTSWA